MQEYKVTGEYIQIQPDTKVKMSKDQHRRRRHAVTEELDNSGKGTGIYLVKSAFHFKHGEVYKSDRAAPKGKADLISEIKEKDFKKEGEKVKNKAASKKFDGLIKQLDELDKNGLEGYVKRSCKDLELKKGMSKRDIIDEIMLYVQTK